MADSPNLTVTTPGGATQLKLLFYPAGMQLHKPTSMDGERKRIHIVQC